MKLGKPNPTFTLNLRALLLESVWDTHMLTYEERDKLNELAMGTDKCSPHLDMSYESFKKRENAIWAHASHWQLDDWLYAEARCIRNLASDRLVMQAFEVCWFDGTHVVVPTEHLFKVNEILQVTEMCRHYGLNVEDNTFGGRLSFPTQVAFDVFAVICICFPDLRKKLMTTYGLLEANLDKKVKEVASASRAMADEMIKGAEKHELRDEFDRLKQQFNMLANSYNHLLKYLYAMGTISATCSAVAVSELA